MSENNLSEIVGEDVNLASEAPEAPETPEAPQATTATPEAPQEQSQEGKEPDSRVVPLAALHEERNRRKELQNELAADRAERARRDAIVEQRLAALTQARQEPVPSFEENPAAHLMHGQQQLQQSVQQIAEINRRAEQQRQQEGIVRHLSGVVQQHEASFVQQAPDYVDAVDFLRNQRAAELMADGTDQDRAVNQAHQELVHLALTRAQAGQNPAAAAYNIAKARGYTAKAAAPAAPTGEQVIKNQQRVNAASKTLGGGGAPAGKITLEALATMTDDEFAEATKGNKWAQLNG